MPWTHAECGATDLSDHGACPACGVSNTTHYEVKPGVTRVFRLGRVLQSDGWIEVRLEDEDGQPASEEAYLIVLPDGTETRGTLDDKGWVRLDGIPSGLCQVGFPDSEAWEVWEEPSSVDDHELVVEVVQEANHEPLEGIQVELSGPASLTQTTDADGRARFEGLSAGEYTLLGVDPAGTYGESSRTAAVGASPPGAVGAQQAAPPVSLPLATRTVFLTFDDGVQPGTQEIYDLLKTPRGPSGRTTKGTFFLTGAHSESNDAGGALLGVLDADPDMELANHSYTHAGEIDPQERHLFDEYYKGANAGGVLLPDGTRRSVFDDFAKNDQAISALLGRLVPTQLTLARLPGRNTWRVSSGSAVAITDPVNSQDSLEEADTLHGVRSDQIFGWDAEWEMHFDGTKKEKFKDPGNEDQSRPKSTETPQAVFDKIRAAFTSPHLRRADKVVVLMHDRAFRAYKSVDLDKYSKLLGELLDKIAAAGWNTDLISNY